MYRYALPDCRLPSGSGRVLDQRKMKVVGDGNQLVDVDWVPEHMHWYHSAYDLTGVSIHAGACAPFRNAVQILAQRPGVQPKSALLAFDKVRHRSTIVHCVLCSGDKHVRAGISTLPISRLYTRQAQGYMPVQQCHSLALSRVSLR